MARKIEIVEIVRHDGPLMLPDALTYERAIAALEERQEYEKQRVDIVEPIPVFPWDGALALEKAIVEMFGHAMQSNTKQKEWSTPQKIKIASGPNETREIPWGEYNLSEINTVVQCSTNYGENGVSFQAEARTTHQHEPLIRKLFARVREIALAESIYQRRAFGIKFTDDDGDAYNIPQIDFVVPSTEAPIFCRQLEAEIESNILTPIRHADMVRKAGIPLKRGVLLAGSYGTGKTLLAGRVAVEATAHGWTFIYVPQCRDLARALHFAKRYMPAIVFCEDIDRLATSSRTSQVNELLNTLDGIGSKKDEIMLVLTSNHAEQINVAMRRPGRIDVLLQVTAPDAEACTRLIEHYGRGKIAPNQDLKPAGEALAGVNPAMVRETVERAKLEAIRRSEGQSWMLTTPDIVAAANTVRGEQSSFTPKEPATPHAKAVGAGFRQLGQWLEKHEVNHLAQ